jgi:RNase P subunit RPR2
MEPIVVERKYCPDCKSYVQAEVSKDEVDPEKLIWQCLQCGCGIEYVN